MSSPTNRMLAALATSIGERISSHFTPDKNAGEKEWRLQIGKDGGPARWQKFFSQHRFNEKERLLFLLALAPHLQPDFYDRIVHEAVPQQGEFPQLGFCRGKTFRGLLPTGDTALFLFGGEDQDKRAAAQQLFSESHVFARKRILWLEEVPEGEPRLSGRIILSQDYIDLICVGQAARPRFSIGFPAELLETGMSWNDLVLNACTVEQIRELEVWVKHGRTLLHDWKMADKIKPGYRSLFYGPPGTGKTLTASLLGKYTGKDVYRVDLSMVVSKFIGETEKNLSHLFAKAEDRDWILFFDEADALFGKRTAVRDAHDRYANQEVSYLLQRVESYRGLVILATNLKSNIDEAFSRRFQSIIEFSMPGVEERGRLWEQTFPAEVQLSQDINLLNLAQKYELTGAEIVNIIQYACLRALDRGEKRLSSSDLMGGISKEYKKAGKLLRQ